MSLVPVASDEAFLAAWRARRPPAPVVRAYARTQEEPALVKMVPRPTRKFAEPHTVLTYDQMLVALMSSAPQSAIKHTTVREIMATVAHRAGVTVEALLAHDRRYATAHPRQEVYYLARALTDKSKAWIGRLFHRDHTTVIHGIRAHAARFGLPEPHELQEGAAASMLEHGPHAWGGEPT